MMDPFVAEIRMYPYTFVPKAWADCDGQLMPLSQNTALFSLLGTFYGGDGKSTFALPDLQGRVPVHPKGNQFVIGQEAGSETTTLLTSEIPLHTHSLLATVEDGTQGTFQAGVTLATSIGGQLYQSNTGANLVTMNPVSLAPAGSDFPHTNMMPYLTIRFCIALQGVFPPRP
ncbi:MAG TPA: tail fiber protein [Thermoanaerobaculia bacterium]|nr:tail fiber protein [Thermoanaerobaculia bacterium]